jgi:hypothetical protein
MLPGPDPDPFPIRVRIQDLAKQMRIRFRIYNIDINNASSAATQISLAWSRRILFEPCTVAQFALTVITADQ